jgi:transposase
MTRPRPSKPRGEELPLEEQSDFLNLLGLRTTLPIEENEFNIWVTTEQYPKLTACPECGCDDKKLFIRNGTRPQMVRHVPRGLKTLYVDVLRQSYLCKRCPKSFQHPLPSVSDRWSLTNDLVRHVEILSLLRTQRDVGLMTGVSLKTIREISDAHCERLDRTIRFETPRVLGLDGVYAGVEVEDGEEDGRKQPSQDNQTKKKSKRKKTVKKQCVSVTDIERGIAVDLWPSARKDDVVRSLKAIPDRQKIRLVVIDMSPVLYAAVKEALPWVIIIIDLFHVLAKANEGMDRIRERCRKKVRPIKGQRIMCRRELLRKHRDPRRPNEVPPELKPWFEAMPELRLAYEVKEAFFEIQYSSSEQTALKRLKRWLETFPPQFREAFSELLSALDGWEEEILNYFTHRFTNAFTEERNKLVKDIQRETRGCYFKTLRWRFLYGPYMKRKIEEARREEMARKIRKRQEQPRKKRANSQGQAETEAKVATNGLLGTDWQLPCPQLSLF